MFVGLYWAAGRESFVSISPAGVKKNLLMIIGFGRRGVDVKNTLVASIDPENKASERVVQKAGFRRRGKVDGGYVRGGEGVEVSEQVWWVLEHP
jgi:L-amino acid N-acyltransferase YncA